MAEACEEINGWEEYEASPCRLSLCFQPIPNPLPDSFPLSICPTPSLDHLPRACSPLHPAVKGHHDSREALPGEGTATGPRLPGPGLRDLGAPPEHAFEAPRSRAQPTSAAQSGPCPSLHLEPDSPHHRQCGPLPGVFPSPAGLYKTLRRASRTQGFKVGQIWASVPALPLPGSASTLWAPAAPSAT